MISLRCFYKLINRRFLYFLLLLFIVTSCNLYAQDYIETIKHQNLILKHDVKKLEKIKNKLEKKSKKLDKDIENLKKIKGQLSKLRYKKKNIVSPQNLKLKKDSLEARILYRKIYLKNINDSIERYRILISELRRPKIQCSDIRIENISFKSILMDNHNKQVNEINKEDELNSDLILIAKKSRLELINLGIDSAQLNDCSIFEEYYYAIRDAERVLKNRCNSASLDSISRKFESLLSNDEITNIQKMKVLEYYELLKNYSLIVESSLKLLKTYNDWCGQSTKVKDAARNGISNLINDSKIMRYQYLLTILHGLLNKIDEQDGIDNQLIKNPIKCN